MGSDNYLDLSSPSAICDALAAGHAPEDLEREKPGVTRTLALAYYEAQRELTQLRQRVDAQQLAIDNAFARAARTCDEIAPDDDDDYFFRDANGPVEPDLDVRSWVADMADGAYESGVEADSNENLGLSAAAH